MPSWTGPTLPARWSGTARPAFVGRTRELAAVADAWAEVERGCRQVVFIGGEPGAGKSRLLAELARILHGRGAAVLAGSCVEEFGAPYQPFVQPLDLLREDVAAGRLSAPGVAAGDAADLVRRLEVLTGRRPPRTSGREHRRRLYDAATDLLRVAAAERPLVLLLEDLHWAGTAGLQLLAYLVERTADTRILVLASHRTTTPDRSLPLVHTAAELYRLDGVRRLDLAGLDTDDITDYLVREAGVPRSRARAFAAVLREKTGGNPFFLRELWRELDARGGLSAVRSGDFQAPPSVAHTIERRLNRMATPHRQVLELAAVIGEEFDLNLLLAASEWSRGGSLEAMDAALDVGLLERTPDSDGVWRFPHALARQAVLDLLPPTRRAREHARVAGVIETRFPGSDGYVQRLAYHYAAAHSLGHADKAVHYLIEAAGLADRSLAHEDAARWWERAASLTLDAEERDGLLLDAARSHLFAGSFSRARDLAEGVATSASPRMRVRAAIAYEAASWPPSQPGHRAVELLSRALDGIDRDPTDPEYVRAVASLGRALAFTGATDEAAALGSRAITLAESCGDDSLLAHALQASLWHGNRPRDAPAKLHRAIRLSEIARRTGDLDQLGPASFHRAAISYLSGDPDSLATAYEDQVATLRATGQGFVGYIAGCMEYARHFLSGEFAAAERTSTDLLELGETFGTDGTEGSYGVQVFMVRREMGVLDQIRPLITGEERPTDHWAPGLLALYTELGLRKPAAQLLGWLLEHQLPRYEGSAQWPGVLAFLVEAALALEDLDAARRLRGPLAEYAGLNLVAGQFVALFGSADRYLGAVDSLLGSGTPEEWFGSALEMDTRMAAPVHQAQTLLAHAQHVQRRQAGSPRLRALVERTRQLAQPSGHLRVLRQLDAMAPPADSISNGRGVGLTARETEVLRLLGEGLSNRDIAARLVISENTAANHVRSILAKTGSENRTQAAMYAAARGLLVMPGGSGG
jgi:DNA-binding CsgD family transcriptional regulator/tetratricopeptide (TPR) repeat protein